MFGSLKIIVLLFQKNPVHHSEDEYLLSLRINTTEVALTLQFSVQIGPEKSWGYRTIMGIRVQILKGILWRASFIWRPLAHLSFWKQTCHIIIFELYLTNTWYKEVYSWLVRQDFHIWTNQEKICKFYLLVVTRIHTLLSMPMATAIVRAFNTSYSNNCASHNLRIDSAFSSSSYTMPLEKGDHTIHKMRLSWTDWDVQ